MTYFEENRDVVVASSSDFTLRVLVGYEHTPDAKVYSYTNFQVCRAKLADASIKFAFDLRPSAEIDSLTISDVPEYAMRLWLSVIHDVPIDGELYKLTIENVMQVIRAGQRYSLYDNNLTALSAWFDSWYDRNCKGRNLNFQAAQEQLVPFLLFQHHAGFMKVTKWLAYNCRTALLRPHEEYSYHINREGRSLQQDGLRNEAQVLLSSDITDAINAAKESILRTVAEILWRPCEALIRSNCTCSVQTLHDFQKALLATGISPAPHAHGKSINGILQGLATFRMNTTTRMCPDCSSTIEGKVRQAETYAVCAFDGLCLSCINRSRLAEHAPALLEEATPRCVAGGAVFDGKCVMSHGKGTWYHSWMGSAYLRARLFQSVRTLKPRSGGHFNGFSRSSATPSTTPSSERQRMNGRPSCSERNNFHQPNPTSRPAKAVTGLYIHKPVAIPPPAPDTPSPEGSKEEITVCLQTPFSPAASDQPEPRETETSDTFASTHAASPTPTLVEEVAAEAEAHLPKTPSEPSSDHGLTSDSGSESGRSVSVPETHESLPEDIHAAGEAQTDASAPPALPGILRSRHSTVADRNPRTIAPANMAGPPHAHPPSPPSLTPKGSPIVRPGSAPPFPVCTGALGDARRVYTNAVLLSPSGPACKSPDGPVVHGAVGNGCASSCKRAAEENKAPGDERKDVGA